MYSGLDLWLTRLNLGSHYSQVHPIFHVSLLKPFCAGGDGYPHPTAVYVEDEQEWEVSGILWHKRSGGKRKYLVAYAGYDEYEACWLPESELYNALEILNDYKVSHGLN